METTESKIETVNSENRPAQEGAIRQAFRPVYITLKSFCLFSDLLSKYSRKNAKIVCATNLIHFVYCLALGSWAVTNSVKHVHELYSITEAGLSTTLVTSITNCVLTLTHALYIPVLLWRLSTHLDEILDSVQILCLKTQAVINARLCRNVLSLAVLTYVIEGLTVTLVLMEGSKENINASLVTVSSTFDLVGNAELYSKLIYVWNLFQVTVYCGTAVSILTLIGCYAFFVQKCASGILKDIKVNTMQGLSYEKLRKCRMNFEDLVDFVDDMDASVSFPAGACHILGMVTPCLLLYGLAHGSLSGGDFTFLSAYMAAPVINAIVFITSAILINIKMHQPLGVLYKIDTEKLTEKGTQELALFISRLSGSPIGISVFGLFVIDTSTVLMMAGTLAAYAVVVMQLQP